MSANFKASTDGTQAIIGVGGVDQMTVSNAGVVTANSFVGLNGSSVTATGSTTARTLANRFADVVNVKDFGAVGDGVADDSLAINRATLYVDRVLGGGTVYYPEGTYKITRAIRLDDYDIETFTYSGNVRQNIRHQGAGRDSTIIKASGFSTNIFASFPEPFVSFSSVQPKIPDASTPGAIEQTFMADGIVIDGLTMDCDYNTNVDGGAAYGPYYGTWGGIWPNGTTGPSNYAADSYQYPVFAYNVRGLSIQNCRIKNSWYNGIEIYRCWDVQIDNNIIENCGDKPNYLGYYAGVEFDNASYRCSLTNNIIKNTGTGLISNGDTLPYAWRAVQEIVVANNIIDTTYDTGVYAFDWVSDWTIIGNEFINIGGVAIALSSNSAPVSGRQPQYFNISSNIIRNYNARNITGQMGIRAFGSGISVCDNSIFLESSSVTQNSFGIVASDPTAAVPSGSSKGVLISNNYLCGRFLSAGLGNGGGIFAGATNCEVSGNVIISTASTSEFAITISADDVNIQNNNIRGTWLFGSGKRAIAYSSGLRPYLKDQRYEPMLDIKTGLARTGLTGWNVVNFSSYTPTTFDNRGNFNSGTNSFVADIPGLYRFTGQVRFGSVGSTASPVIVAGTFELNGLTSHGYSSSLSIGTCDLNFSTLIELNANDIVTLKSYGASTYTINDVTNMSVEFVQQKT
jgi:parallel beta-helix repeat protein